MYAHEVNDDLVLNTESISEPNTFLMALRDYSRLAARKTLNPAEFLKFGKNPDDTALKAHSILDRSTAVHKIDLTRDSIPLLMNGFASELVVADSIRKMLAHFDRTLNGIPTLMEWTPEQVHNNETQKTDRGFEVLPVGQTNTVVLGHSWDRQLSSIGEVDLIVETPSNDAFLIDVTTSEQRAFEKIQTSRNENPFQHFRQKVKYIFDLSGGLAGYRDVQKMHIVCKDHPLTTDYQSLGFDANSIHIRNVSRRKHVEELSQEIICELKRLKLLSFDRFGSARLHDREGNLPKMEVQDC